MGIFQLSDGKKLRTPDGLTKKETAEWLFTNLEGKEKYAEDRARIGDKLETSGWGATIGGTLGGIAGGVAGIFTSPSVVVNPITLGATVGAGGAAIGEGIEQWITGKGDWSDIGWAGAEGGVYGAIPGVGGQAAKVAGRTGLKGLGRTGAAIGASGATGAVGGAGIAGLAGQDPKIGAAGGFLAGATRGGGKQIGKEFGEQVVKDVDPSIVGDVVRGGKDLATDIVQNVGKNLGISGKYKGLGPELKASVGKIIKGTIREKVGRPTGRLMKAEGWLQLQRTLIREASEQIQKRVGRKLTANETSSIKQMAGDAVNTAKKDYDEFLKKQADEIPVEKPKLRYDNQSKTFKDELGNTIDPATGKQVPGTKSYAGGGLIPGYQTGGQVRRSDPEGRYRQRVAESGGLRTASSETHHSLSSQY